MQFFDSSCKDGEPSKYAGWTLRFTDANNASKPAQWERTITEKGRAKLGWYTNYAIIKNKMRCNVTLYNLSGVEQATYTFEISPKTGKQIIEIDLATAGVAIEVPMLEDLELAYDPDVITYNVVASGKDNTLDPMEYEGIAMPDGSFFNKARTQSDIERFFKEHDFITIDDEGNVHIGNDIVGTLQGNQYTGQFTIDASNVFTEQTLDEWVNKFNQLTNSGRIQNMMILYGVLGGTLSHKTSCQFTVTRDQEDNAYVVTYKGNGTYTFQANAIKRVNNLSVNDSEVMGGVHMPFFTGPISTSDVTTQQLNAEGTVALRYTTKLRS